MFDSFLRFDFWVQDLRNLYTESGQTVQGSLSAVSKPIFVTKYALESSWQDLQIPYSPHDLNFQFFENICKNIFQMNC